METRSGGHARRTPGLFRNSISPRRWRWIARRCPARPARRSRADSPPRPRSSSEDSRRDSRRALIYHPLVPGGSYPVRMAVHTTGDPLLFASRLRSIARDVEPTLQISEIARFDQVAAAGARTMTLLFWSFLALAFVVVLLSLTGIYSVLSFTASQRTREVGIRVALGGRPRHVVAVLFRGPMTQIVLGILIGLVIADRLSEGDMVRVIAVYGCAVVAISALATLGPVRRALRIQPIDALRAE